MQIQKCDAENIVLAFRAFSAHIKFDAKNLVGNRNDSACVMAGINNDASDSGWVEVNPATLTQRY